MTLSLFSICSKRLFVFIFEIRKKLDYKLFDSNLIWFEEGHLCVSNKLKTEDLLFVKHVTTIEQIEPQYINERMLAFFDSRSGIPSRLLL